MNKLFKDAPFASAFAIVAAGTAAWLGARWSIIIALFIGLVVGAAIDTAKATGKNAE